MKYKNNLTLTNPRRVPFSLSNRFDDTFGLTDMVSDCKNAEDFCAAANKYDRFHLKWKIDKDSKNETRLTCKDTFGNIDYLIAYKEDSGLPEIPTGNMITELRSRGYSVSVDKPEKIISKKDLGKLFQEAQIQTRMNWTSIASLSQLGSRSEMSLNMPARNRQIQCFDFAMITDC